jgi:aminomethyltransferase
VPTPTPLLDRHEALGARIIDFAGWLMPVSYAGIIEEHRAVRSAAGLFDLSHMGELVIEGPEAGAALAAALVTNPPALAVGRAHYSMICAADGGILDDLIVYRLAEDRFMVVANASNARVVSDALAERLEGYRAVLDDRSLATGLVAVQGPRSLDILGPLTELDLAAIRYYGIAEGVVAGIPAHVARTGYTGEDGVELGCMADEAGPLWDAVLARGITPAGLGARDTLRLEVCYPLHGNDIGPQWDAISSGLGWACALDTDFTGVARLREIKERGPEQKLVPFRMTEKAIPRQGMAIIAGDARGEVTSGSLSPMLDVGIGMGYVPAAASKIGTELVIDVRGKERRAEVAKKPLYKKES